MERRSVLRGVAAAVAGLAGCLDGDGFGAAGPGDVSPDEAGEPTPDPTPTNRTTSTPDPTETVADPTLVDSSFARTEDCPAPGEAAIDVDDGVVGVEGCIRGEDGCTGVSLEAILYDTAADELELRVTTVDRGRVDEPCTRTVVALGYEASVTFEGGAPDEVRVVHETFDGQSRVALREDGAGTTAEPTGSGG